MENNLETLLRGAIPQAPSTKHQAPSTKHQAPSTKLSYNLLKKGKKTVAITAAIGTLGLSGCVSHGLTFAPRIDLQEKSAGLYVTNDAAKPTNDVGYDNSEEGMSTTTKVLIGAVAIGIGVLVYNANKSDNNTAVSNSPPPPIG